MGRPALEAGRPHAPAFQEASVADSLSPFEPHPDQIHLEEWLAANPPQPAGNGGPALEEEPSYEALARIGRAVHGRLWEGKVAEALGEGERNFRRWRNGEGRPSARTMAWAREWGLRTAADVLDAAGERDLADDVRARLQSIKRRAAENGRAIHAAAQARAAAAAAPTA